MGIRWKRSPGLTGKAKEISEKGLLLGDGRAASNLGLLLEEDGDHGGAKAAFKDAAELGVQEVQERLQRLDGLM